MSVTLIAAVVALVLGHLAPSFASAMRQYGWFGDWLRWLGSRFDEDSFWYGRWGMVIALVPPLLAVGFFQVAMEGPLLGLADLLFGVLVLFYVWGPRDLDRDVDAVVDARDAKSRRDAVTRLTRNDQVPRDGGALVEAVFTEALRRWFGVLFWFLVLGPVGAVLYRLTALAADGEFSSRLPRLTGAGARTLLGILDWPVAQLLTLSLALVGNFDAVLGAWRERGGASFDLRFRYLHAAARASVRSELAEEAADYESMAGDGQAVAVAMPPPGELPELRDAMSLIWRCLLVWLAVLALFIIAGFVN